MTTIENEQLGTDDTLPLQHPHVPQQAAAPSAASSSAAASSRSTALVTTLSLLAMAKDARYVQECQDLLQPILQQIGMWLCGSNTTTTTSNSEYDSVNDENTLVSAALAASGSSLLYALTIVPRLQRTAGMQSVGLEYNHDETSNNKSIVGRILLSALLGNVASLLAVIVAARTRQQRQFRRSADPSCTSTTNRERLKGASRRQVFEQQRQTMLRRATAADDALERGDRNTDTGAGRSNLAHHPSPAPAVVSAHAPTGTTTRSKSITFTPSVLWSRVLDAVADLRSAAISPSGPHDDNENDNAATIIPRTALILQWILRLHLAQFCWNGRFPSLWHRLFWRQTSLRLPHDSHGDGSRQHHHYSSTTAPRVVGLLILAQAVGTAVHAISRHLVYRWVDALPQQQEQQQQQPRSSIRCEVDRSPTASSLSSPSSSSALPCAICRQPRRFTACSVHCGHVFCWNCWQQWISTTIPACPLCRRSCRANEVVLLHGYNGMHEQ